MKWKETLIGALISLLVAISAGVLVVYVTSDAAHTSTEKLVFYFQNSATFDSSQGPIRFVTVFVKNAGGKSAHNVKIIAQFGSGAVIEDKRITLSSGPIAAYRDLSSGSALSLNIENFSPTESAVISALVKNSFGEPSVGVQSDESIGDKIDASAIGAPRSMLSLESKGALATIIISGLLFQWVAIRLGMPIIRGLANKVVPTRPSLNNTGFLYLQQGLARDAEFVLRRAIMTKGADAITLANYALALGLKGDSDGAKRRFDAAEWWAHTSHEKAVVAYNKATLFICEGNIKDGRDHLIAALSLSKNEISSYCGINLAIRDAASKHSEIAALL